MQQTTFARYRTPRVPGTGSKVPIYMESLYGIGEPQVTKYAWTRQDDRCRARGAVARRRRAGNAVGHRYPCDFISLYKIVRPRRARAARPTVRYACTHVMQLANFKIYT
jgi:hypothetical protein